MDDGRSQSPGMGLGDGLSAEGSKKKEETGQEPAEEMMERRDSKKTHAPTYRFCALSLYKKHPKISAVVEI